GAQLRFAVQPTDATAGAAIAPAVTVTAVDPFGNIATSYTGSVTVGLGTNPGGGALAGSSSVAAVAGVARFTDLSVATAGTGYTLTATAAAPGVAASTSSAFTITAATANHVAAITSDHQSATVGTAVAVAPAVIVKDQFGNPVAGVSLMFAVATGGGSLTGTNPVTTNGSGIAAI